MKQDKYINHLIDQIYRFIYSRKRSNLLPRPFICGRYLTKGRQLYAEGRLQTRSWEDQQGQKRYTTEIVATTVQFLGAGQNQNTVSHDQDMGAQGFGPEPSFDAAEEIPF